MGLCKSSSSLYGGPPSPKETAGSCWFPYGSDAPLFDDHEFRDTSPQKEPVCGSDSLLLSLAGVDALEEAGNGP